MPWQFGGSEMTDGFIALCVGLVLGPVFLVALAGWVLARWL
jgi:hypothetical protein